MTIEIYGIHAVASFIEQFSRRATLLKVSDSKLNDRVSAIVVSAQAAGIAVERVRREWLDEAVDGNHQGVLLLAEAASEKTEKQLLADIAAMDIAPLLLILDSVTDPHNLGACLRTAEAAGVTAVIIPKDKSVGLTPVVRRVASGAADIIPLVSVTNLARCMKNLQEAGVWIVGTAGDAETVLFDQSLTGPLAIVLGAEGDGIRRLTREHCDFMVNLPMAGTVSSLNVSVAAGVCLFEAVRQRR